jgi:hypothetical protein
VRALVAVAVAVAAGCAGSSHGSTMPERPVGEDLLALLPSGADGVVDVDVAQLDSWSDARRILALLPPAGKQRLQTLGSDPLAQIEALAIAITKPGTPEAEATIVARGQLDFDKLRAAMSDANEVEYHDARVVENEAEAMARVTPSVYAFGSRVAVRRVLDVAHKEDEGLRTAGADAPLRQALQHAPTAKLGRPAIMAALVLTPPLRERLRKDQWSSAAELDWVALSFAVGDGFDVGIVAGARSEPDARDLADTLRARATSLRSQATVRLLGLGPYVEPFKVVAHLMEVHMAYRLSEARVEALLTRLQQMQAPAQEGSAVVTPQAKPGAHP